MPRDRDHDKNKARPGDRRGPARGATGRDARKPRGDRPSFGRARDDDKRPARRNAGEGRFGDRKPGGKSFEGRKEGRRPAGEGRGFAGKPGGFRKDSERPARRSFDRSEGGRPARRDDERPARRTFRRDDEQRAPRSREDRPFRGERSERSAGAPAFRDRAPRRDFERNEERPRSRGGDFKRGDDFKRSGDFKRGGDRPRDFGRRDDRPRDFSRSETRSGERPAKRPYQRRDAEGSDRRPWEDRPRGERSERNFDRPRFDKGADRSASGRFDRTRDRDVARGERPRSPGRSTRDRNEETREERPARPRAAPISRDRSVWRDHPRRDEMDERRDYERRPAFGGRGDYRARDERGDRRREDETPPKPKKTGERIAKLMARAGLCSRRDAEEWIKQGRVAVNGREINSPALDILPGDQVTVDGAPLPERERTRLFLYHKPKGLVTTHSDPEGRPTVFDALPADLPRLISVGRLDYNTEGLLLLTNDGGLARTLELPDTGWLRRYRVRAHGEVTQAQLDELRKGVEVDGVKYGSIEATLERDQGANVWIVFAIREGKNREVRNVMAHLGLEVNRLIRVSYGPFQLGEIGEGEVEEVRSRLLRDQLGERIAKASGADFKLPKREDEADDRPAKPRRAAPIEDRKGRRVRVERSGETRDSEVRRPARIGYKGKRDRKPRSDD